MTKLVLLCSLVACGTAAAPAAVSVPATPAPAFEPTSFVTDVHGSGRPVILIPGLGCPGSVWDETVAHLHAQSHVLTLAGFAGRPPIGGPLSATVRDELARYIRDRHLDHPVIIGHSMGGFIAYWLAAAEPDLVGPVVIIDAAPDIDAESSLADKRAQAGQMRDAWIAASDAEFAQQVHQFFAPMARDPRRIEAVIAAVAKSDHRAVGEAFYELFTTDLRPEMAKIHAPVLVVLADTKYADGVTHEVEAIPRHEVKVLAKTRHFVMFDDPPGFFGAVDAFLAAHP